MLTDIIIALIGLLFFILLEWGYIYFARTLGLTAPALKGAKKAPAIGGGVIFYVAAAMGFDWLPGGWLTLSALLGLTLIAGISMADDIRPRGILSRLAVQIISVGLPMVLSLLPLALWENQPPALSWWLPAIIAAVFVVGFMNEFNFMDGIDGLTGLYSLVVLLTLTLAGIPWQFSAPLIASALAFCIFNFRKYSLCFAGDVGAVTMGAIIGSMIVCLPDPLTGLGCVAVYLTDASLTILTRWHAGKIFSRPIRSIFINCLYSAKVWLRSRWLLPMPALRR